MKCQLERSRSRLQPFKEHLDHLRNSMLIVCAFISPKTLENLPGRFVLGEAYDVFEQLTENINDISDRLSHAI